MSRHLRIHVPHGTYFVVDEFDALEVLVAAAGREHTDAELHQIAKHRIQYEHRLTSAIRRWRGRVHAHCWLPNSALLMVQIGHAPLDWLMHSVRGPYSLYLRQHTGTAHPHAGRYRALLLDDEEFFLDLPRYMFRRAVTARLCSDAADYEHCSLPAFLTGHLPLFLAGSELPSVLVSRGFHTRAGIERYLLQTPSPGFPVLLKRGSLLDRRIAGRAYFIRQAHVEENRARQKPEPQLIIEWVADRMNIAAADIMQPHRSDAVTARALIAWLASCSGAARVSAVAQWFPRERSNVERSIHDHMRDYPDLFSEVTLAEFVKFLRSTGGTAADS